MTTEGSNTRRLLCCDRGKLRSNALSLHSCLALGQYSAISLISTIYALVFHTVEHGIISTYEHARMQKWNHLSCRIGIASTLHSACHNCYRLLYRGLFQGWTIGIAPKGNPMVRCRVYADVVLVLAFYNCCTYSTKIIPHDIIFVVPMV